MLKPHPGLRFEEEQRLHRIDRGAPVGRFAEHVVEDLQRQRTAVTCEQHVLEEGRQVELALAGKASIVPAPLQNVHGEPGRIGELEEEDPLAGNIRDSRGIVAERENVEAVEDEPEVRVVDLAHDLPGIRVMVNVLAPRQRFVTDAQIARGGALGEHGELRSGAGAIAVHRGRYVGTKEEHRRAELLHHVELTLHAIEIALEHGVGDAFEVAEGLIQVDTEAEVGGHAREIARRAVERDEIVLEDLDRVEARRGNRFELIGERPAQTDGGDGFAHASTLTIAGTDSSI